MNLGELRNEVRVLLFDTAVSPHFSDASINLWLNEAESEACRRARLIVDSQNYIVETNSDEYLYDIDSKVIGIRRVKSDTSGRVVKKITYALLDCQIPGWENKNGSVPMYWFTDMDSAKIGIYPRPSDEDTLYLTVVREPLEAMELDTDSPEIPVRFHWALPYWAAYRALTQPDPDRFDPKSAERNLAQFEQEFGRRRSAVEETYEERYHMMYNDGDW